MHELVLRSSKYTFFLTLIVVLPIYLHTDSILEIWLSSTPDYTGVFTKLLAIDALITSLGTSLMTAAQATGRIKKYQIVVGTLLLVNFPASLLFLHLGFLPSVVFVISVLISILVLCARIVIVGRLISMPILSFFKNIVVRNSIVFACALLIGSVSLYRNFGFAVELHYQIPFSIAATLLSIWFLIIKKY